MDSTSPSDFAQTLVGPITVIHVVLMIALAAAAILMIWYGARQRRRRRDAEREVAEDRRIAEAAGATAPAQAADPNQPDGGSLKVAADEPPQPVAVETVETPVAATPEPAAPTPAPAEASGDLTQLKGLGPKLAATLAQLGYTRIDQIAALTPEDAATLDAQLGAFQGRMARDRWIEQARLLSAGDRAGYEGQFGKL
jgi:predicted flap endonuclease-1-like 5' DNA nuclease